MKVILLYIGKIINNLFGFSMGKQKYFPAWKYFHTISLMGIGRIQGHPIEKSGELEVMKMVIDRAGKELTVMDVGANKGQYSDALMQQLSNLKKINLHLFEPSRFNTEQLSRKFNDIRFPGNHFSINMVALSNESSTAFLYTDREGSDLGSLLPLRTPIRPFDDSKKENINTETIDAYVSKHQLDKIDLLKIDVEGGEFLVLSGAKQTLETGIIKNIQFEFGAGNITSRIFFLDFWEMLSSRYHFHLILNGGLVPIEKYSTDWEIFRTVNYFLTLK
jgi:FkbM family methyltransferase